MDEMVALGVTWTTIAFGALQSTAQSVDIPYDAAPTVTDDEVRWAIRAAKRRGLRVCLKPVVNVADGTWRAFISFFARDAPGEPSWSQWFAAYQAFVVHFARLAEEEGCDLFYVGCEMVMSDGRDAEWRGVIRAAREVYRGPITYNCDKYQEDQITWWDDVDVMSSSGYYPTGTWEVQLDRIETAVVAAGKPFFFMEAGCPSREGSALRPNDWAHPGPLSLDEQERYYQEMFAACASRDWAAGLMLWDWPAHLYSRESANTDEGYCVYGKPSARVVSRYYTS
ncbi:MAG: 1,4-beta-xylanase [Pseudolysinimonas sp.]